MSGGCGLSAWGWLMLGLWLFPVTEGFQSTGRKFVLGFMEHWAGSSGHLIVEMTTTSVTPVTVRVWTPSFNQTVQVDRAQASTVTLPSYLLVVGTGVEPNGVLVEVQNGSGSIMVVGTIVSSESMESFLALPVSQLGTRYYALTFRGQPELMVIATEQNTTVSVTLPPDSGAVVSYQGSTYRAGDTLTASLGQWDTWQVQQLAGHNQTARFSGARIDSDKPVAILSGNRRALQINLGIEASDGYLVEMLPPVEVWGTSHTTVYCNSVVVVASEKNTTVLNLKDGSSFVLSEPGSVMEVDVQPMGPDSFVSNKPVLMASIANYQGNMHQAMSLVAPHGLYARDYTWAFSPDGSGYQAAEVLSVIINQDSAGGLTLDGKPLATIGHMKVAGTNSVLLLNQPGPGFHHLSHKDPVSFQAVVTIMRHGPYRVSAYPAGFSSDSTYHCEIAGDPHVQTFGGQTASLAIPCAYLVANLRVTNDYLDSEAPFYQEIQIEIHAGNSQRSHHGRYYVSDVGVIVTFFKDSVAQSSNAYYTGELLIENGTNWRVGTPTETMQDRVQISYDPKKRMATLEVTYTSVRLQFRPVDRNVGIMQHVQPGVFLKVDSSDLIYDPSTVFPATLCSTVDDTTSIAEHGGEYSIEEQTMGLFAVLDHMTYNIAEGDQDPMCPTVMGKYIACDDAKETAFNKCFAMMADPAIVRCFDETFKDIRVTTATSACLDFFCSGDEDQCSKLRDYTASCPEMAEVLGPLDCQ
ncbi:uncharacterized protein LOC143301427 [Babylonia areolata]|uniref:uncharacterized protein LOC143301427 n=1 Tax=Babylonia areolata TaxID=304850 RepID=UPI003FD1BDCF